MGKKKKKKHHKATEHKVSHEKKEDEMLTELENIYSDYIDVDQKPQTDETDPDTSKKEHKKSNKDGEKEEEESTIIADIIQDKRKKRTNRIIIGSAIMVILLGLSTALGFWYFSPNNSFTEDDILLTIEGPEKVKSGEEETYTITYKNQGKVDIKNAKLIFRESDGFDIKETEPAATGRSWNLDTLLIGQEGTVSLTGVFADDPDQDQELKVMLLFVPLNFNSEFTAEKTLSIDLEAPEIEIKTKSSETTTLGEKVPLEIQLTNNNLDPINTLKVEIEYPEGFEATDHENSIEGDDNAWKIKDFEPATQESISLKGTFPSEMTFNTTEDRKKEFKIKLLIPNADGEYFVQTEEIVTITIVDQALIAYMILNGSSDDKTVNLEDNLQFSVVYKNKGDEDYANLSVIAVINTIHDDILDWDNIDDEEFGKIEKTDTGKTITWGPLQIADLENVAAGEEGTINFSIPIKKFEDLPPQNTSSLGKNAIEVFSRLQLTDDSGENLPAIESSKMFLSLNSNVSFSNEARYYYDDGTPIGLGPLPPIAGEKTVYVIFWELNNSLHELENIEIKTSLADNVNWLDKTIISAGEVKHDTDNNEITWSLNRLPLSAEKASLTFHLEVEPTSDDVGKLMKIINTTVLTATDTDTEDTITITKGILSTNLDEDEFGLGKGVVTEAEQF